MRHHIQSKSRQVVYVVDYTSAIGKPSYFYENPKGYLHENVHEYDTFGDHMVQHSPLCLSIKENAEDFCASFLTYLKNVDQETRFDACQRLWHHEFDEAFSTARWEFFSNLKYKEGKYQYFNKAELKVSSRDKLAHDRRWEKVERWFDGKYTTVLGTVCPSYYSFLSWAILACKLQTWWNRDGNWVSKPEEIQNIKDFEKWMYVVEHVDKARRALDYVETSLKYVE